MKRNIIYSLTGMLIFVLTACTDDWLNNEGERMPEGEVSVSATVEFLPLRPALDVNTRTAGDVIKDINDLCVLLYDEEGNPISSAPHPQQILKIKMKQPVKENFMLRKKKENTENVK